MVATQQVWENHDMGALDKERLTVVLDLQKLVVTSYAKSSSPRDATSNIPQSPLQYLNLRTRLTTFQHPNHTNPGYSNHVTVHADHDHEYDYHDSSTLYRGCIHSP
jgi:hypothetical protein